jgi:hypothetical protein
LSYIQRSRKEITKYCASFFNKIKLGIKEPTLSEKTIEMLKKEVNLALTERGYEHKKIAEWLEYVE